MVSPFVLTGKPNRAARSNAICFFPSTGFFTVVGWLVSLGFSWVGGVVFGFSAGFSAGLVCFGAVGFSFSFSALFMSSHNLFINTSFLPLVLRPRFFNLAF